MTLFIGMDPGTTGSMVALDPDGFYLDGIMLDHDDGTGIRDWLSKYCGSVSLAALENVHSMPTDGGIQAFEFGRQFERMSQTLVCLRIPFQLVGSKAWQASAGIVKPTPMSASDIAAGKWLMETDEVKRDAKRAASAKRKSKVALKRAIADHARRRWPSLPMRTQDHWALADAAFLADHARKLHLGMSIPKEVRRKQEAG